MLKEPYRPGSGLAHRLDPRVKVLATVGFILSAVLLPDGAWLGMALSWAVVLLAARAAQLPFGTLMRRALVALPFMLAAVTIPFTIPGDPLWVLPIGDGWVITEPGAVRFASIIVRSWLAVQAAIVLMTSTRFPDVLYALRYFRVPEALTTTISFMYRYLFVLLDEGRRLRQARTARSAGAGRGAGGRLAWRAEVAGSMVGQLFLRSYERSERVYDAMLARGFRGQARTLTSHRMQSLDWTAGGLLLVLLVVIQTAARFFGG